MDTLRRLWVEAQSVLREMSPTQRVAVTALLLTVALLLMAAVWFGAGSQAAAPVSLPIQVDPADQKAILDMLRKEGVKSAEYQLDSQRITVDP